MTGLAASGTDWFSRLLYESPWPAIVVLAVAWTVMRIVGRRTQNKRLSHASWAPLVLIVALWVTARAVTTPREQLATALGQMLAAVEADDRPAFRELVLAEAMTGFSGMEMTRDQVEARLDDADIEDLTLLASTVEVDNPTQGTTYIRVRAEGRLSEVPGLDISEWAIRWRYDGQQWQVLRLKCTAFGARAYFNND